MLVMAAASGILAATGGHAFADASVEGAAVGSPGIGSGNAVQAPVHAPVNLCGNTANVIGLLNSAFGQECANEGGQESGTAAQGASAEGVAAESAGVVSGNLVEVPVDVPVNACGNTVDVVGALNPAVGNECGNESGNAAPSPVDPPKQPVDPSEPSPVDPPKQPVDPPNKPPVVHDHPHHHEDDCPPDHQKPHWQHGSDHEKPHWQHESNHQKPHWQHESNHQKPHWQHHHKPQLAHTGADTNLGLAGGASAALVLGGALLVRRTRASKG
ncbi:chaplin [Streptomyces sp. NPDC014622]|uniref:chaplin n=1 Tax=Streptomyces sp. NPDC014622 TaxID=3364874 RepID=UPI0036FE47F6